MAPPRRNALVALGLLSLAALGGRALAIPSADVRPARVPSLAVAGWRPGALLETTMQPNINRVVQLYRAEASGALATVETRCTPDARGFLSWTGKLPYEGAGYGLVAESLRGVAYGAGRSRATVSQALLRGTGESRLILYAYLDRGGVYPLDRGRWPRVVTDLILRRPGPYCMLSVGLAASGDGAREARVAAPLLAAFLPAVRRLTGA